MKIIILFLQFSLVFIRAEAASKQEEMQKQIEEMMKAREEIFRSLMDDSSFEDMSKRMEKMMQSFGDDDFFSSSGMGDVVGEYDWIDSKTHKILSLKVKQIKDKPLDIKIKNGKITIKGDIESQSGTRTKKQISRVHFERVFSIPSNVDDTNPEFENKSGELLIKFKKKFIDKELVPVKPNTDDQTI